MPDLKEKNRIILKNSKMHELWDLGAPTILEQALQTIVAYVDTAMVGQIGAIASAAVGLTSTVNWLLNGILFAVSMGMLSFIAQYTGQGDLEAAHHTSAQAIWIIFVFGVIETVIALAISPVLPMWMGASQEIWRDASEIERKPDYIWKCIKGKQGFENTSLYKYWCEFFEYYIKSAFN